MGDHVRLRLGPLPDDASLLVHLGAGAAKAVAERAVANYLDYDDVAHALGRSESGLFTVSTFGLVDGVQLADVLAVMQHGKLGQASLHKIRGAGFDVHATSNPVEDADFPTLVAAEAMRRIQEVHFDIELAAPGWFEPGVAGPLALEESLLDRLVRDLTAAAEGLMTLFAPREARYDALKAEDPTMEDRR